MYRHARRFTSGLRIRRDFVLGLLFILFMGVAAALQSAPRAAPAPSSHEWITVNKDYSSQRYVDLDQITPANVGKLKEVCELQINEPSWFNSGLLMVGRTIYVNTLTATYALDAATCDLRWRHDIKFTPWLATNSSRGSGYWDGKIFRGTADGRVIALNAKTGRQEWQTQGADPTRNEAFISAPIAWNGKVFIGIVTADLGVRGRLQAFDTKTGKELWRFNTIPIGIEEGASTWKYNPEKPPAGGAFWTSYTLDPTTGELFGPVSNPFPDFARESRLGDNLYTDSVISLDATAGKLSWFFQAIAGDDHDWDLGAPPTLYTTPSGKRMLAIAGKEGLVLGIDRDRGHGQDRTKQALVFKTPGTTLQNPEPLDDSLRLVCPGSLGGSEWNGTAYHPKLGILYSGMVDFCFYYSLKNYSSDPNFWGSSDGGTVRANFSRQPRGWITAMDGETGKPLWNYQADGQVIAGLVPTRSGLLFGGDVRGNLLALDAKTGKLLNRIDAGGALNNGLISYAVDGTQYVAAAVGGLSLNPAGVSGPLRVSVYGLNGSDTPKVVKLERGSILPIPVTGEAANAAAYGRICGTCHGFQGQGYSYPPLLRHTELKDPAILKDFLSSVPPPMPILYPGLLEDKDVQMIAAFLKVLTGPGNTQAANSAPPADAVYKLPTTEGTARWKAIYSVFTFPRCINCHTVTNYPRQRDIRYPHIYSVVRGTDDFGAPVARCQSCHGSENNPATGIPGAPNWHLAPLSMAWETKPNVPMTGPELCAMLQDRLLNGDRDLAGLLKHVEEEKSLVSWAWEPGTRWNGEHRTTPPISRDEFLKAFREWVKEGGPCPTQ